MAKAIQILLDTIIEYNERIIRNQKVYPIYQEPTLEIPPTKQPKPRLHLFNPTKTVKKREKSPDKKPK